MNKNKIRGLLIEREGSIEAVAKRIREPRTLVSATINYHRLNLRVRKKLIATYGVRFSPGIQIKYSWRTSRPGKRKQPRRPPSEAL